MTAIEDERSTPPADTEVPMEVEVAFVQPEADKQDEAASPGDDQK